MDDQKIIKLLWQRAESAIEALAKKFGNKIKSKQDSYIQR